MLSPKQLKDCAVLHGTPTYVFDIDAAQERAKAVRGALGPKVALCYAMKANPFLVSAMTEAVDALEVCSPGELAICRNLCVPMEKVAFSGVQKTAQDIAEAVDAGVGVYTAESIMQVRLLQQAGAAAHTTLPVLLRLTSGSQFGMDETVLREVIENRAQYSALCFVGLHYFVGTQRKKTSEHIAELARLGALCDELRSRFGFVVQRIEYGPGLWMPYFTNEDFCDTLSILREIASAVQALADKVTLTIELGRFLTAACGWYLTRVMDVKQNCGANYCLVDGGVNHVNYYGQMMGMKVPILYRFAAEELDSTVECSQSSAMQLETESFTICGSLCTTADVLVRSVKFNALRQGDIMCFANLGAYAVTEGIYLFLSRKLPKIILYSQKEGMRLVRDALPTDSINTIGAF